jgi:hypothetical protein
METSETWQGWAKEIPQLNHWEASSEYVSWNSDELGARGFLITSSLTGSRLFDEE